MWKPGDRLSHRHNPDLGTGRVLSLEGRTLVVEFPAAGRTLRLAAGEPALVPVAFPAGAAAVGGPAGGGTAPRTYTVQKGDTLSKISKQYYGDANSYMKIFEANKDKLKDPDKIQVGQVLVIP